jgi:hypothetical protein
LLTIGCQREFRVPPSHKTDGNQKEHTLEVSPFPFFDRGLPMKVLLPGELSSSYHSIFFKLFLRGIKHYPPSLTLGDMKVEVTFLATVSKVCNKLKRIEDGVHNDSIKIKRQA